MTYTLLSFSSSFVATAYFNVPGSFETCSTASLKSDKIYTQVRPENTGVSLPGAFQTLSRALLSFGKRRALIMTDMVMGRVIFVLGCETVEDLAYSIR